MIIEILRVKDKYLVRIKTLTGSKCLKFSTVMEMHEVLSMNSQKSNHQETLYTSQRSNTGFVVL